MLTPRCGVSATESRRGKRLTGCGKTPPSCHSERSEESRSEYFQRSARFLVVPINNAAERRYQARVAQLSSPEVAAWAHAGKSALPQR